MKEYTAVFPDKKNEGCKLGFLLSSLDFLQEREKFKMSELQRYLMCGYGTVIRVIDALCILGVIDRVGSSPCIEYIRLIEKGDNI